MSRASQTGGVKPMSIAGRLISERERLLGMTDEERQFRKQWLKDQILSPNEPRHVPELERATRNPIRRFYRWPLDQLQKALTPVTGETKARVIRYLSGKACIGVVFSYYMYYYFKYHSSDWTRKGGVRVYKSRDTIVPGDPNYPSPSTRTKGSEYATRGFDKFTLDL